MNQPSKRSRAHSRLASCAVVAALLAGCGGGGSDAADAAPAAAPIAPAAATAYAKTIETSHYIDNSYGMGRGTAEGLVETCNGIRTNLYRLSSVLPSEELLASFDDSIVEKYFTADKALTKISYPLPFMPDLTRWFKESSAGSLPATPPDCVFHPGVARQATLWRDGMVYRFLFDEKKAVGRRATQIPALEGAAELFASAPEVHVVGQTCRDIVNPPGLAPGSDSCVWNLLPYVSNLNWPFILRGRLRADVVGMTRTIEALEARAGQPIDSSVFEIPADLKVIVD